MDDKTFYDNISEIVNNVLQQQGVLVKQWHHGIVDEVISIGKLKVKVDGSSLAQTISCNPDVNFQIGDHVWVTYINGNPRDKFIFSRRYIS